jgi:hypothetical protein
MGWLDPLRTTIRGCRVIIWLAAWLVPGNLRAEWKQLWNQKVWHWVNFLAESGQLDARNRLVLARYCWSSFSEAFWIRFERDQFLSRKQRLLRSPLTCLGVCLALFLALLFGGSFISRSASLFTTPITHPEQVAVVGFDGNYVRIRSETLLYLGSVWKASPLAGDFALYSWGPAWMSDTAGEVPLVEAKVAPGFFQLLGIEAKLGRLPHANGRFECADCAVLSHDFWRVRFHGDPHVIGREINLNGHAKVVIGVLPSNFHLLSSGAAVWTTLDESTLRFSNFIDRVGGVARLKPGATLPAFQHDLTDRSENAGYRFTSAPIHIASAQRHWRRQLLAYGGFLLLALVSAGGIAWIFRLRSGGFGPTSPDSRHRLRWWTFFLTKSALLAGIAYFLAWIAVHQVVAALLGTIYPLADEVSVWVFLPLAVVVLSWSIADQQKRCRSCLRRLVMPIDIGRPGSVLLNFAGTEMVCSEGHGILYVPESDASSLERDRWSRLDDTWSDLFRPE